MKVQVLGCSGGIGGRQLRTTSLLVDHDVLIDAGTGVGDLSLAQLSSLDYVFLTHSHLDHVACLPFIVDTVGDRRSKPLVVYGLQETISTLQRHIFNWSIWPDFTKLPTPEKPYLSFKPLDLAQPIKLGDRVFTALPANHAVPAVGYQLSSPHGSLVFSGDTEICPNFWEVVNSIPGLRYLIVETAFSDREKRLAVAARHLFPSMLSEALNLLERKVDLYITHLKPGQIELIMREILDQVSDFSPKMLQNNQVFEF